MRSKITQRIRQKKSTVSLFMSYFATERMTSKTESALKSPTSTKFPRHLKRAAAKAMSYGYRPSSAISCAKSTEITVKRRSLTQKKSART